jgi:tRNA-2-methylthio-N6-dimethylallyladenosine synthase
VYLETYGCQMNEADAALVIGRLDDAGYVRVTDAADADVVLLATCAVRERAEERIYGRANQLLRHRKDNPNLVFGIIGCMATHVRERLSETAPHVTLVAGPDSYRRIADLVDEARAGQRVVDVGLDKEETYEGLDGIADDDGVSGQVAVMRGCDKFCTFCVVPYTRGRERGVAPEEILRRIRALAARGYREVVLLGQTVNSYRHGEVDFSRLLERATDVDGIERIRFTSPHPVDFSDRLVDVMARERKVCPHVHLPAQSGSDEMLVRMRRGYTRAEFMALVRSLRERIPGISLSTDIMVGFCGETDRDHAATLSLLEEVRFDSAFMFRYSDRGVTIASRTLEDDVPGDVKAQRLQAVIDLQEIHTRAAHRAWVGRRVNVLVSGTSRRGDCLVGRTPHFFNVLLPLGTGGPGNLVEVDIQSTTGHSLVADGLA